MNIGAIEFQELATKCYANTTAAGRVSGSSEPAPTGCALNRTESRLCERTRLSGARVDRTTARISRPWRAAADSAPLSPIARESRASSFSALAFDLLPCEALGFRLRRVIESAVASPLIYY